MIEDVVAKYPCDLIVFGALGDLSCRKLFPALYQLERADLLHSDTRIIGCARDELTLAAFIPLMKEKIQKSCRKLCGKKVNLLDWKRLDEFCQLACQWSAVAAAAAGRNGPARYQL